MTLNLRQTNISAHYLENKLTEFTKFYAFILTRSRWELLLVMFCLYESWPLCDVRILVLLNVFRFPAWKELEGLYSLTILVAFLGIRNMSKCRAVNFGIIFLYESEHSKMGHKTIYIDPLGRLINHSF